MVGGDQSPQATPSAGAGPSAHSISGLREELCSESLGVGRKDSRSLRSGLKFRVMVTYGTAGVGTPWEPLGVVLVSISFLGGRGLLFTIRNKRKQKMILRRTSLSRAFQRFVRRKSRIVLLVLGVHSAFVIFILLAFINAGYILFHDSGL